MLTIDDINEVQEEFRAKREELRTIKKAYAEQECPFNVGDIVEACGRSFRGKKGIVRDINYSEFMCYGSWVVDVSIIKNDGTASKGRSSFHEEDYRKWVEIKDNKAVFV